ncbi:MAG: polyprenyl synthetase family protein [Elusimicrobiota bacterium]|nr:polyprenyl synthetase family protein [Elusimicrobiota bacterium]
MNFSIEKYLKQKRVAIEATLDRLLHSPRKYPPIIHQAMRYAVFGKGKRLRPVLLIAAAEACGGKASDVLPAACAIEMIHSYSLIHDDLPAIDDDDYRRGKLSCHKKFGEAMAILAGDALLTRAFEVLSRMRFPKDGALQAKVIARITQAIGTEGMLGGQVEDIQFLSSRTQAETKKRLGYIHSHKTGALINVTLKVGAILAGASRGELKALDKYGKNFGLAFQITDDMLDKKEEKELTYPRIYGLKGSREKVKSLVRDANLQLKIFRRKGEILKELIDYFVQSRI